MRRPGLVPVKVKSTQQVSDQTEELHQDRDPPRGFSFSLEETAGKTLGGLGPAGLWGPTGGQ